MIDRKRQILFVDDDPLLIRGLKRSSEEYSDLWEVHFATSGEEALRLLEQQPMDVIITDMRMPVMDGTKLLENVSQDFPGVMRFVLSGNTDNARILQVTRLAHQFIAKPCKIETLVSIVERACSLRDILTDPALIQLINSINNLPSIPALYIKLVNELESDDPTPKVVGNIIAQDVAMTAKILQLVNSAFFGLSTRVTRPQNAVTILGLNTIKALVLGIHIFSEYQGHSSPFFSIDSLWSHSILVGNIASSIAQSSGLNPTIQSDAQLSGVLHDVGKLLQLQIPNYFQRVVVKGAIPVESEYKTFGASHAEMGAYLLGIWGLPDAIVEAVALHHRPTAQLSNEPYSLVNLLHIANGIHNRESAIEKAPFDAYLDIQFLQKIGISRQLPEWSAMAQDIMRKSLQDE